MHIRKLILIGVVTVSFLVTLDYSAGTAFAFGSGSGGSYEEFPGGFGGSVGGSSGGQGGGGHGFGFGLNTGGDVGGCGFGALGGGCGLHEK
jgi:hypothetical protein